MEETTENSCDLCKISYATDVELREHFWSLMHHIKIEKRKKGSVHNCTLCFATFPSIIEYGKHLNEDKHKRALEESRKSIETPVYKESEPKEQNSGPVSDKPDVKGGGLLPTPQLMDTSSFHQRNIWPPASGEYFNSNLPHPSGPNPHHQRSFSQPNIYDGHQGGPPQFHNRQENWDRGRNHRGWPSDFRHQRGRGEPHRGRQEFRGTRHGYEGNGPYYDAGPEQYCGPGEKFWNYDNPDWHYDGGDRWQQWHVPPWQHHQIPWQQEPGCWQGNHLEPNLYTDFSNDLTAAPQPMPIDNFASDVQNMPQDHKRWETNVESRPHEDRYSNQDAAEEKLKQLSPSKKKSKQKKKIPKKETAKEKFPAGEHSESSTPTDDSAKLKRRRPSDEEGSVSKTRKGNKSSRIKGDSHSPIRDFLRENKDRKKDSKNKESSSRSDSSFGGKSERKQRDKDRGSSLRESSDGKNREKTPKTSIEKKSSIKDRSTRKNREKESTDSAENRSSFEERSEKYNTTTRQREHASLYSVCGPSERSEGRIRGKEPLVLSSENGSYVGEVTVSETKETEGSDLYSERLSSEREYSKIRGKERLVMSSDNGSYVGESIETKARQMGPPILSSENESAKIRKGRDGIVGGNMSSEADSTTDISDPMKNYRTSFRSSLLKSPANSITGTGSSSSKEKEKMSDQQEHDQISQRQKMLSTVKQKYLEKKNSTKKSPKSSPKRLSKTSSRITIAKGDKGASVLETAEKLCKELRDKREVLKLEKARKEKQKKMDKHDELNQQIQVLSEANQTYVKGHLDKAPTPQPDAEKNMSDSSGTVINNISSGVMSKNTPLDNLSASESQIQNVQTSANVGFSVSTSSAPQTDIERIRQDIENSVKSKLEKEIQTLSSQKSSEGEQLFSPSRHKMSREQTESYNKDALVKLVNSPRSHKERLKLAGILRTYAESQNKLSLPRFNLKLSGLYDNVEDPTQEINIQDLSPDIQLQIAQLMEADTKPDIAELEKAIQGKCFSSALDGLLGLESMEVDKERELTLSDLGAITMDTSEPSLFTPTTGYTYKPADSQKNSTEASIYFNEKAKKTAEKPLSDENNPLVFQKVSNSLSVSEGRKKSRHVERSDSHGDQVSSSSDLRRAGPHSVTLSAVPVGTLTDSVSDLLIDRPQITNPDAEIRTLARVSPDSQSALDTSGSLSVRANVEITRTADQISGGDEVAALMLSGASTPSSLAPSQVSSLFDQVYDISLQEEEVRLELGTVEDHIGKLRRIIEDATVQLTKYEEKKFKMMKSEEQLRGERLRILQEARSLQSSVSSRPDGEITYQPSSQVPGYAHTEPLLPTSSGVPSDFGRPSTLQSHPTLVSRLQEQRTLDQSENQSLSSTLVSTSHLDNGLSRSHASVPGSMSLSPAPRDVPERDLQNSNMYTSTRSEPARFDLHSSDEQLRLSDLGTPIKVEPKSPTSNNIQGSVQPTESLGVIKSVWESPKGKNSVDLESAGFITLDSLLKTASPVRSVEGDLQASGFSEHRSSFQEKEGRSQSSVPRRRESIRSTDSEDFFSGGEQGKGKVSMKFMGSISGGIDGAEFFKQIAAGSGVAQNVSYMVVQNGDALQKLQSIIASGKSGDGSSPEKNGEKLGTTAHSSVGDTQLMDLDYKSDHISPRNSTTQNETDSNYESAGIASNCSLGEQIKQYSREMNGQDESQVRNGKRFNPLSSDESDAEKTLIEEEQGGATGGTPGRILKECSVVLKRLELNRDGSPARGSDRGQTGIIPSDYSVSPGGNTMSKVIDLSESPIDQRISTVIEIPVSPTQQRSPSPNRKRLKSKKERDRTSVRKQKEDFWVDSSSEGNSQEEDNLPKLSSLKQKLTFRKKYSDNVEDQIQVGPGGDDALAEKGEEERISPKGTNLLDEVELDSLTDSDGGNRLSQTRSKKVPKDSLKIKPDVLQTFRSAMKNSGSQGRDRPSTSTAMAPVLFQGPATPVADVQVYKGFLYVCYQTSFIYKFDCQTGQYQDKFDCQGQSVQCLLVTSVKDGEVRLYTGGASKSLLVFDAVKIRLLNMVDNYEDKILCLHENWGKLYTGLANGTVVVKNLITNKYVDTFHCSDRSVSCLGTATEGSRKLLCVGSHDALIYVCDANSGLLLRMLEGHTKTPFSLKVDGDCVYSGSGDKTVMVHNLLTGDLEHTYGDYKGIVTSVCIQDDLLLSASYDKYIRCYDKKSHRFKRQYYGAGRGVVTSMVVHNNKILSGNREGLVEAIPLNLEEAWPCQWENCSHMYGLQEHLLHHVQSDHTLPNSRMVRCMWKDCKEWISKEDGSKKVEDHFRSHMG